MRAVKPWAPKSHDTPIPNRVRDRVYLRHGRKCDRCGVDIGARIPWEIDHIVALANGGEHCESNLQPLCRPCHRAKTETDVAEKAKLYRIRCKHIGIRKPSRMPGARNSKWKKKLNGQVVLRVPVT